MQPADYKHIRAWGRFLGSDVSYVRTQQIQAAKDNAPIDAIYKRERWIRYGEVTSAETRFHMDRILHSLK